MCETKKKSFEIKESDKEFFQEFIGVNTAIVEDSLDHKKLVSALDKAHDIRKFEIELYWKRATYFFAFFTVITAAFGFSFSNYRYFYLSPAFAIVGYVFSACFYYVNIGSKYWQENWEYMIDKIEFYVTGNLYKVYFYKNSKEQRPSVSKINLYLSKFIVTIWLLCFVVSIVDILTTNKFLFFSYSVAMIYSIGSTLFYFDKTVECTSKNDDNTMRHFKFRKPSYIRD
ncbi:RipA family octameric membrane protein [Erwinia rhapontici]|uniref:RipA family octameric membrane protein n=1 Tax=Erwinia rhapontici TaxID=55212 RepID=UPI0021693881|nr:hypothetical protein [Erwinia rhapontici]MCS3607946.1 hypothetical protein [Erwinia rhapontici]